MGRLHLARRIASLQKDSVVSADKPLILALPKGRILKEVRPLLSAAGLEPEAAFDDSSARQLTFNTNHPNIKIIRVRSFDVATFVAFGGAQIGICGNDVLAWGCLHAISKLGFSCPEDFSVTGIGDFKGSKDFEPPLTTVRIPARKIGSSAAKQIAATIIEQNSSPNSQLIAPELVARMTCAPI